MERRFEGTFQTANEVRDEIKRLINEEGYSAEELLVITDEKNSDLFKKNNLESVEVDIVDSEENGSFWEKIKETLSFGTYDSKEAQNALEIHGVPHNIAEHHLKALTEGEIVLLADTDAPKHSKLSNLNKNVTNNKETENNMVDKNNNPIDEVNSEEVSAIKNNNNEAKPSDVETSETDNKNMTDSIDPSQAQDTREEDQVDTTRSENKLDEDDTTEDSGQSLEITPDLTGEEETVQAEDANHEYPDNIAKGVVKPETKNPLNTDPKSEKDPSEKSDTPESDAKYTQGTNEAGMKEVPTEESDKK
ncbi:Heat induced stress protein YflT [Marinilactibacillus piezotolerans]|uniref:Heat induced stress protein YflT n=1 Tax=Marinilactibacillus piezotolerans TaxID=258723 RepID=A0A1I3UTL2_9LACT|nr:general stress protein [Marinilactibacillus piezotolerans]SFJ85191.1 Heat induced stress protein YflT [Marinilactibacillus piezotolerans]